MPRGSWSFLHEWVIYEYLLSRCSEKNLRLNLIIQKGILHNRTSWKKVDSLDPIIGTTFPDINALKFIKGKSSIPGEVKFTTSLFNYHKEKDKARFVEFIKKNGIIIVLSHDYIPKGLDFFKPTVYEMDYNDFVTFCRENFERLLSR